MKNIILIIFTILNLVIITAIGFVLMVVLSTKIGDWVFVCFVFYLILLTIINYKIIIKISEKFKIDMDIKKIIYGISIFFIIAGWPLLLWLGVATYDHLWFKSLSKQQQQQILEEDIKKLEEEKEKRDKYSQELTECRDYIDSITSDPKYQKCEAIIENATPEPNFPQRWGY